MKIGVLSRNPKGYTIQRIKEAARKRGHRCKVLDTLQFSIFVEERTPLLTYKHQHFDSPDVIIPRIGPSVTPFGTAVVRQFEQMGVFCLNTAASINMSRDKLRTLQILSRHDIGIPSSAFVRQKSDVLPAIEQVGGVPVIIKLIEGSQGVGVILAESVKTAEAIIETLQTTRQNVLVQRFVAESRGKDVRAFVVGGRVVAAMRRRAQGQEFRSNVHRGGATEAITLDPEYERTAVQATQILGLRVAGVDMLEGADGPQVMEVNSSPGLEGIEAITGVDIAGAIIDHINDEIEFPDIDLRQRLTLKSGYGVTEFVVDKKSELAGKKIGDTNLRDREILILNIERGGVVIPAPHGNQDIMVGDKLFCFGKTLTLKSLLPTQKRRKKKSVAGSD